MIRSRAFLLLNLAHFFDHFVLLILPTAALATNRQDYAGALAPAAWAFVAFALATLPAGWLGDHWGRARMMRVFWFGTGAACLIAGLSFGPASRSALR
jgi:MFS family permease